MIIFMSIITWNCQGACNKKFPSIFKSYVHTHKPDLFVLFEPRISGLQADKVISKLGFQRSHRVEARGFSGGIWVLWSTNIHVDILANHFQFIHMRLSFLQERVSFLFSAIYGSPQPPTRKFLWEDLANLAPADTSPWLLTGDFNATVSMDERRGGAGRPNYGCSSFKAFIHQQGLIDLGSNGSRFTWQRGTTLVRLDRALANQAWLNSFPMACNYHLARVSSDHRPIQVKLHLSEAPSTRPFRFLAAWLTHQDFRPLVANSWDVSLPLSINIHNFTTAAQTWNRDVFGEVGKKKRRTFARLAGVQHNLEHHPFSPKLLHLERVLSDELETLSFQEELLWLQKSTSDWVCLGDRNTAYYHTKALIRKRRNRIGRLKSENGVWVDDEDQLRAMAFDYFSQLYSVQDPVNTQLAIHGAFPELPAHMAQALACDITETEIKHAIFDMKPLKAPGKDGLHALFFQSQWSIVGPSLLVLLQDLWKGSPLDPSLNSTLIALIPKVESPTYLREFRPISLCSVAYKVITKVLANRIQDTLPILISQHQTSFIQGRHIIENTIIAQEVVHSMRFKQGKEGWMAIKVDLEKAFDRLSWEFIEETLHDANLPPHLVQLIMSCITSSSMQVLWNGKPTDSFLPQRGIRQGDPISPYIFVLCMERLSQMILAEVRGGAWKAIKMGRHGVPLSHLFFADDLVLFSTASPEQAHVIKRVLHNFCSASGQKVSQAKTTIFFSRNTRDPIRHTVVNILGFQQAEGLGKYLGVPLLNGRVPTSTFNYILERVQGKLAGWKRNSLSLAGRITLAKSVLSSIPFYTMQSMLLPTTCCKKIEQVIRNFIWGKPDGSRGVNLVKWSEMCLPIKRGGSGFLCLESQNKAFLAKLIFTIHSAADTLWVRILRGKYGFTKDPRFPRNSSTFWRNIKNIWQDASMHVKMTPGDGSSVKFWADYWIGDSGPLKLLAYADISDEDLTKPIRYYLNDHGGWKHHLFEHLLPPNMVEAILSTRLAQSPPPSSHLWSLTPHGRFTVKSAYEAIESINWKDPSRLWANLWKVPTLHRVRTFAWLLLKGKLLTNSERCRRRMTLDPSCSICSHSMEDNEHVFKHCAMASKIWKKILPHDLLRDFLGTTIEDWLRRLLVNNDIHKSWQVGVLVTCWKLWATRNHHIFTDTRHTPDALLRQILNIVNYSSSNFTLMRAHIGSSL